MFTCHLFVAVAAPTNKSPDSSSEKFEHNEKHEHAARTALEAADSSSGEVDERRHSHRQETKRASEVVNDSDEMAAAAWLALRDEKGSAAGVMRPRTRKYARGMPGVFPAGILG